MAVFTKYIEYIEWIEENMYSLMVVACSCVCSLSVIIVCGLLIIEPTSNSLMYGKMYYEINFKEKQEKI